MKKIVILSMFFVSGSIWATDMADTYSAFFQAAEEGDNTTIQHCLDARININRHDNCGDTALIIAAGCGNADTVQILINAGADVDLTANRYTSDSALDRACEYEHIDIITMLLAADAYEGVALLNAAASGKIAVARALIAGGADVDVQCIRGESALSFAAANGHTKLVKLLLRNGAKVDPDVNPELDLSEAERDEIKTALEEAVENGHTEIVRHLCAAGAEVTSSMIINAARENRVRMIRILNKANPDDGCRALIRIAQTGRVKTAAALIAAGVNVDEENESDEETALIKATNRGHTQMVRVLLDAGASIKEDTIAVALDCENTEITTMFLTEQECRRRWSGERLEWIALVNKAVLSENGHKTLKSRKKRILP